MQKTPKFDAKYDPVVTESKGMQKIPEFDASYDPIQAPLWACGQGDTSTPSFGTYLNPISTRGCRLCPPYTGVHTKF